jgi:hypothetical protein
MSLFYLFHRFRGSVLSITRLLLPVSILATLLFFLIGCSSTETVTRSRKVSASGAPQGLFPFHQSDAVDYLFDFSTREPVKLAVSIGEDMYQSPIVPNRITYIPMDSASHLVEITSFCGIIGSGKVDEIQAKIVMVGLYICHQLKSTSFEKDYGTKQIIKPTTVGNRSQLVYEFAVGREIDTDGFTAFFNFLRNEIIESGSVSIRRPSSTELDWYWTIIPYDIVEPVFIIESPGHSFFIDLIDKNMCYIDDLRYLSWSP